MRVTTTSPAECDVDWLVLISPAGDQLPETFHTLDTSLQGKLSAVWQREEFTGKYASTLDLRQVSDIAAVNIVLVGTGQTDDLNDERIRRSLLTALRSIAGRRDQSVAIVADTSIPRHCGSDERWIELVADCVQLADADADLYKQKRARHPLAEVQLCHAADDTVSESAVASGTAVGDAVRLARRLVNRTAYQLTPAEMVREATTVAERHNLTLNVLDASQLRDENMTSLLAVAQGSDEPPAVVQLTWQGAPDSDDQLALVGKGVTFDSGGLSIKPSDSMIGMKADMAGAATALAAVTAAAEMKLPVNVTAWLGLVENMISGRSYRPGDVITARNGTTIEVRNTDAEGRLVLADVLDLAIDRGATHVIDLATLTGACVVALGEEITGMFPGCRDLAGRLQKAANTTGELLWEMPMHAHFDELLRSDVADCSNVGPRWGGAVTAACFLRKFVGDTPWVHLDIAGPSWADSSAGWRDSGGTGAMVRTLTELLRMWNDPETK